MADGSLRTDRQRGEADESPAVSAPRFVGRTREIATLRQAVDEVSGLGLTTLAGALRPLFPEWVTDLPPALEPAEDALAARHRLFRALVELIGWFDVDVLVMEDVHWGRRGVAGVSALPRGAAAGTAEPGGDLSAGAVRGAGSPR